jgi:hypothetical protein
MVESQDEFEVRMVLTRSDVENAERIRQLIGVPNNAQAVSFALSLARFAAEEVQRHKDLLLMRPDGTLERIVMKELQDVPKEDWGR